MWASFDVTDVLEALEFGTVRVVAGNGGLGRQVSRARRAPAADELRRASAGDVVVTSAEALADIGDSWEQVVVALDTAGAAAVIMPLDDRAELAPALLAAADRADLPVIVVPVHVALSEISSVVLDALLVAQQQRVGHMLEVHQRFNRIVLAGGGPADIAAALHELVGCTVAVLDADGHPIVVVPEGAAGLDALDPDASGERVSHVIRAGDHAYGEIVALGGQHGVHADAGMALERAAMAVAMRLAQAAAVAEAQERFAAITLEELISGHAKQASAVAERAASFGWDLASPRAVLLASIDPPLDGDMVESALATIAAAARATLGADAIVWRRSSTIAALIAPHTEDPAERRRVADRLRRELDQRLRSVNVSIGVGRRVTEPTQLASSFVEAARAVDVGRWAKGRHVTEVFDELGLERLLAATTPEELAAFVRHAIGPLHDHDAATGGELVETLAVWLETRNMAEAARRLHVHYNTLKNRLQRIEAVLGPVLSDAGRALECAVAAHVARHYDIPWAAVPR